MAKKVLLITGAAGGIGAETCRLFAKNGYAVAFGDISRESGEALLAELRAMGAEAAFFPCNATKAEEVEAMVRGCVEAFGRVDVLVNNAGGLGGRSKVAEMTDEFYNRVMDLNMTSAFYASRAAIPHLKAAAAETGDASIINITSIAAYNGGGPGASVYAASKAAVLGWSKGLAKELVGERVRVNLVSPGTIDTAFHSATAREIVESWKANIPAGRLGRPGEVAKVIAFLAGEDAVYLVGEVVQVNGGQMMD